MSGTHLRVTYKEDHGMIDGFGGLLRGPGTASVAHAVGKIVKAAIVAQAVAAEGRDKHLTPGRVVELFSNVQTKEFLWRNPDKHPNPRRAVQLEVTGAYEGKDGDKVKSSPVTIEFGSKYNEGTPGDRPAQHIMGRALKKVSAAMVGMNIAGEER